MIETLPKIAFLIIDNSHGGGVEKVTADLVALFQKKGYPVLGLASLYQSKPEISLRFDNLEVVLLNPKDKTAVYGVVLSFLKQSKPDYLIFQGDNMSIGLSVLQAAKDAGVRAIPQYHGSPYAYFKKYPDAEKSNSLKILFAKLTAPLKIKKLKKFIEKSEHGLVCVSEGSANELRKIFRGNKLVDNILTIRNPVYVQTVNPELKERTVIFVSRLESRHKNAFLILSAWERIAKQFPGWTLKIFGEGSMQTKMDHYIRQKKMSRVSLEGFTQNINLELAKAAVAVSTSNTEGFSMAVAEAAANRCAIAITDSDGGISDMIQHGSTGLVSPKNDAVALAENIALLISDEDLRNTLAEAAFNQIQKIAAEDIMESWNRLIMNK